MFGCGNVLYIEMSVHYPRHNMLSNGLTASINMEIPPPLAAEAHATP